MTLAQYLRVIREQWWVVFLFVALAVAGAAAYTYRATPMYQAEVQLFVSTSTNQTDIADLSQGSTFTQQRVKSYADVVTSPTVLRQVIDRLHLPYSPRGLAQQISASSPLDTVLLDVTVNDTSPERARDIANELAVVFPQFVDRLETPNGDETSPVKISITNEASTPTAPVSPRRNLNLALGLLVGLGLGIGAGVLRDSMDRTIGTRHDATEVANAPVLGMIIDDSDTKNRPLMVQELGSQRSEAFRQLRTNIRFLSADRPLRSFVVTSSVAGEGKSTTAANLALALAKNGESVVLIDADLRQPVVADLFGLTGGVGLTNVLIGDVDLGAALQRWRADLPLHILTAGRVPPNPSELLGSESLVELIRTLTDAGATVVFDSPPLLPVTDAAILARLTEGALLVTRVGSTRTDQLATTVQSLATIGAPLLGLVLNRVPKRGKNGYQSTYGTYGPPSGQASLQETEPMLASLLQGSGGPVVTPPRGTPIALDERLDTAPMLPVQGPPTEKRRRAASRG